MLLKIVQTGDECLRKTAKKLTLADIKSAETQKLIDLMIATVRDKPGVGLAAPQIGESLQIIVIEDRKKYIDKIPASIRKAQKRKTVPLNIIINPVITIQDSTNNYFFEGCLSIEGYCAIVPRADKVTVSGLNRHGKPISISAEGWFARIIQHEVDHLGGKLYIDKMQSKSFITDKHFTKSWAKATPEKIASFVKKTQQN